MTDMEYSRNERSISSWISIGSMNPRSSRSSTGGPPSPSWPLRLPFLVVPSPRAGGRLAMRRPCSLPRVPGGSCLSLARLPRSDVEEADVLCVRLDEVPAPLDVVAHEDRADVVGERGLLDVDLEERALRRVDRRVPELVEVHLAEALQPLEVVAVVRALGEEGVLGGVVLQVHLLLAHE